jgi:ABC-2 type transport system permease protein
MFRTVRRYARLYRAFLSQSLKNEMIYRSNFLTLVLMDVAFMTLNILLFRIIYGQVDTIAGWTFYQSMILIGTVGIVREMAYLTFRQGFLELGDEVRRGLVDTYMVRPMAVNLHLAFRHVSLTESLGEGVMGFALVAYGFSHLEGTSWVTLPVYLFFLFNSLAVYYGFSLLMNSVIFWVLRSQELNTIVYFFMESSRYPGDIFRGFGKIFFTFVIPIAVIATAPASVLAGPLRWEILVPALIVSTVFLSSGLWVWQRSLRHYSSASG